MLNYIATLFVKDIDCLCREQLCNSTEQVELPY